MSKVEKEVKDSSKIIKFYRPPNDNPTDFMHILTLMLGTSGLIMEVT
jgi:hypothetical protein